MTPSDEAVEKGARALYDLREDAGVKSPAGSLWPPHDADEADDCRMEARAVLDAAFPSGEQPGEVSESGNDSGEYQRAVSDLEARQEAIDKALSAMRGSEYVGGPTEREAWRAALDALGPFETQHQGQAFAPTSEGEK